MYLLQITRALKWPDTIPKLCDSGSGDYDSTSYHPGWKYWEEHTKVIMCSPSLERVKEMKNSIEKGEVVVNDFTNRPYILHIVVGDEDVVLMDLMPKKKSRAARWKPLDMDSLPPQPETGEDTDTRVVDARDDFQKDMQDAKTSTEMITVLQRRYYGYEPDWDVINWCEMFSDIAFNIKKHLTVFSDMGDVLSYARFYLANKLDTIEYTPPCSPALSRGAPKHFRFVTNNGEWALQHLLDIGDQVGKELNSVSRVAEIAQLSRIPHNATWFWKGYRIHQNHDYKRIDVRTIPFVIDVVRGLEDVAEEIIRRVIIHNSQTMEYPTGQRWVVCKERCAWHDFDSGVPLPEDVFTMPECDLPIFIGTKGKAIKAFNVENQIGGGGIVTACVTYSPQLPVIFLSPYDLYKEKRENLIEEVERIAERQRGSVPWWAEN